MWPRIAECVAGVWLIVGGRILPGLREGGGVSVVLGCVLVVLALLSFRPRLTWMHWVTLGLAFGMIGWPMTRPFPVSAVLQNVEIVGWVVAMFAVIPNRSNQVPEAWRNLEEARVKQEG